MTIERGIPDPNEKDTFQQVNRRAGYGTNIHALIRWAKLGHTMAAGEAQQIVAYYEEQLAEVTSQRDAYHDELQQEDTRGTD